MEESKGIKLTRRINGKFVVFTVHKSYNKLWRIRAEVYDKESTYKAYGYPLTVCSQSKRWLVGGKNGAKWEHKRALYIRSNYYGISESLSTKILDIMPKIAQAARKIRNSVYGNFERV